MKANLKSFKLTVGSERNFLDIESHSWKKGTWKLTTRNTTGYHSTLLTDSEMREIIEIMDGLI